MVAAAAALLTACSQPPRFDVVRSAERNVLLITVDTLRADAIGIEGGAARTPAIDALARAGIRFTFAHSHAVVTLPSHASILTGRYPFEHGYRENSGYRLAAGTATLASRLKAAGFATGAFIGGFPLDARFGLTAGFDEYDGRFDDSGSGAAFVIPERPATVVIRSAMDWQGRQQGRWFAWVHLYDPHAPYRPPAPFDREYPSQPYYGEVAAVDAALAPLLASIAGSARPTLVVLTADHGEALGEHGEATHGLFAYESTLRVPLIIAEIGRSPRPMAARDSRDLATAARHVDIVPTILDAVGVGAASDLPGHSLRTAADRDGAADRASYFEAMSGALEYGWSPLDGVLVGRRKFINLPIAELYDLERDAAERDDRASNDRDSVRTLEARLAQFDRGALAAPKPESPEVVARLRSLGYTAPTRGHARTLGPADDPKRLVHLDRQMHDAAVLDEQGRLDEATALYERILTERPQMSAAARHLAFDQWRAGKQAAAVATLERAIAASGPSSGVEIQLGAYLMAVNRVSDAVRVLRQAADTDPTFDALHALGLAYARAGQDADARAAFARARAIDPRSAILLESIGAAELEAGHFSQARTAFEEALSFDADATPAERSRTHTAAATAAARAGDLDAAIEHWSRAVAADPANFDALYDLGVQLARAGRAAEARPHLRRFVAEAPRPQYARELANVTAILNAIDRRR